MFNVLFCIIINICSLRYSLIIDDQKQTIQGVKIADPVAYRNIKFTVKSNVMEGWQPSYSDIEELKTFAETSYPDLGQKFQKIFEDWHEWRRT